MFVNQPWYAYIKHESWMDRVDRGGDPNWPELRDDAPDDIKQAYEEFKKNIGPEQ